MSKAAETFPTRMALYVLPVPWRELKNGAEMQLRVKSASRAAQWWR